MRDIAAIRGDFPILKTKIFGRPLVYLDNAATTHKPRSVLDAMVGYYTETNSGVHRGAHYLSERASAAYENARETVRDYINAGSSAEIIFTRGTTEAINLVAHSFGEAFINEGDEIIISEMEHHSNIVPWQSLCERKGAVLGIIPFNNDGSLIAGRLDTMITRKTKLISLTYVSNVLGVINNAREIIATAHAHDVPVLIDGAQAVQHMAIDVRNLDCDFFAFSGHKMYAGTGIGVLYGKAKWLDAMPPYQGGGGMISTVSMEGTTYADAPFKFEAGTGNIAGAVGLAAAIEYINDIGIERIADHERDLLDYAAAKIGEIDGVTIYGDTPNRCGALSFNLADVNPYDAGMILNKLGIAVRAGTHCAEPVMRHYGVSGTVRASFALYNTQQEIDGLIEGIRSVQVMLHS